MNEKNILCNRIFDKTETKKLIEWFLINYGNIKTNKLLDKLKKLGFKYSTIGSISLGVEDLKIPKIKKLIIGNAEKNLEKTEKKFQTGKITAIENLDKIINLWTSTNELLKNELIKNFRQTDLLNPIYIMAFSGARGNILQIKQLIGMRGLMSDAQGEIINLPIKSNFKEGLKITEYFISCYGARKGLIDTALKTANSGYLTRRLIYAAQNITIKSPNCKTTNGILINNKTKNYKFNIIKEKIVGRVLAKNLFRKADNKLIASKEQDICNYLAKKIIKENKKIYVRSPLTCNLNIGICQLCYGWNLGNGRLAEIGEAIGVIAAQSIGEPGTQLTMRTFHTGGIFSGEVSETINSPHYGKINYNDKLNGKIIRTKFGEKAFFTLKQKSLTIKENQKHISKIIIPRYSIIFEKNNNVVNKKQVIAEISNLKFLKSMYQRKIKQIKETIEIKTEISGKIILHKNNIKNKTKLWILKNKFNYYKHFFQNLIIQPNSNVNINPKKPNLKYKNLKNENINSLNNKYINIIKINNTNLKNKKNKLKNVKTIIKLINRNKKIFLDISQYQKNIKIDTLEKTNKIGKLLYKEIKLNEKTKNKNNGQIIEQTKNKIEIKIGQCYLITEDSEMKIKNKQLIEKNSTIFNTIYNKQKTKDIVQGLPKIEEILEAKKTKNLMKIQQNPHDKLKKEYEYYKTKYNNKIANRKSIQKVQNILIEKVQSVYSSQGIKIADKHIEVIVKQMTSKVIITEQGNSKYIPGEIININQIEKINKNINKKAKYEPIILGITKTSLSNESFISAAGFQETTRILTKAAIKGEIDWLIGLKENIILGNLIPIGTGYEQKIE